MPEWVHQYKRDLQALDVCIDSMYMCIDCDDIDSFKRAYKLWYEIRKQVYDNPLNDCGHKLSKEITDYAKKVGIL